MDSVKFATVSDLIRANKVLKQAKNVEVAIRFPALGDIENSTILTYHDASYANLTNRGSQGGNIPFFLHSYECCASVMAVDAFTKSRKINLGVKTLSLADAAETSFSISSILAEIFHKDEAVNQGTRNIECVTDTLSLFETVHSTTALADKSLRVDMADLCEMKAKGEIKCINWIPRQKQLADCLTKKSASPVQLLHVLESGKIIHHHH